MPSTQSVKKLTTQSEAVIRFIQQMDPEMLDLLLDDSRTYQDFTKQVFLSKLGRAFEEFRRAGDSCLNIYRGKCCSAACGLNRGGYSFVGNDSGYYMDLIIRVRKGIVQDIYECHSFNIKQEPPARGKKIRIDDPSDVF